MLTRFCLIRKNVRNTISSLQIPPEHLPIGPEEIRLLQAEVPKGTEIRKLTNKSAVVNIYIGRMGDDWRVQLNGDLVAVKDIPARIENLRAAMSPENAEHLTVSLRADRRTPMGIISDVKQALQQSYALRINYSATEIKQGDNE